MKTKIRTDSPSCLFRQLRRTWDYSTALFGLVVGAVVIIYVATTYTHPSLRFSLRSSQYPRSPYGRFPIPDDPFHFLPCTNSSLPPPLAEADPLRAWAASFDPDPNNWSWGEAKGPHLHRGIYLCGFLDLPLNPLSELDDRIVRLAVTKYQVSGLALVRRASSATSWLPEAWAPEAFASHRKSERTIILEPGGPGGSGTNEVWLVAEDVSARFSSGQFDVLGWDPRGVNASHPSLSCYPHDVYRDRWAFFKGQYREEVASPLQHLRTLDAMNNATFYACHQRYGDFGRFVDTTFVARDLEGIRRALGEDQLTGHFVSYGTAVGTTYANMYPDRIGRLILDGAEYIKDQRQLGGFAWASLDDVMSAWRDGLLAECLSAGPKHCPLAKPAGGSKESSVTLPELEARLQSFFASLIKKPMAACSELGIPTIITYSQVAKFIYVALYDPKRWPLAVQILHDLERGNTTLATEAFQRFYHRISPTLPPSAHRPGSAELPWVVICADAYDAAEPEDGLEWWDRFWADLAEQSWISGSFRLTTVLQCRHYKTYWPSPPGVYRGDLNTTLSNPVLVISGTHDPVTPLSRARKLVDEMGSNARLVVHHAYGHMSEMDRSDCTDSVSRAYILNGTIPSSAEVHCYANEKPYGGGLSTQFRELGALHPLRE